MGSRDSEHKKLAWQKHFIDQKQSGLSRAEYCRRHKLSYDNFQYHLKRIRVAKPLTDKLSKDSTRQEPADMISFKVDHLTPEVNKQVSSIELSLQSQGQTLSVKTHWTTAQLLEFITAWRGL
ncbi:MAG: hypothetical protein O2937_03505 [Bacteroidetes bacterium]|nr:hypothetical protein [Bacteroidota bacterium]